MRHRKIKVWRVLFTLLTVLSTMTAGAPPAVAAEPSVRIREAGIQARGAGLVVGISVVCPAETTATTVGTNVTVSQVHADKTMTFGTGSWAAPCTGAPQVARVVVFPFDRSFEERSGAPFRSGVAFVSARHYYSCLPIASHTCRMVESARTVELRAVGMDNGHHSDPDLTFTLLSSASLEANGAGVKVSVSYSCTAGLVGVVEADLLQRTSADAVTSSASAFRMTCSGSPQSQIFFFPARTTRFKTGAAFVVARGEVCKDECARVQAHRTISVA